MNRWAAGENPFTDADWSAAWQTHKVSDSEWAEQRAELRTQADAWQNALRTDRNMSDVEMKGAIGSVAHLAYHLGAIRQILPAMRGPKAND